MDAADALRPFLDDLIGPAGPVGIRFWDDSRYGAPDPPATVVVRTPNAIRRMVRSPGELGMGRAYVAGELDLEGDLWSLLDLGDQWQSRLSPRGVAALVSGARRLGLLAGPRPGPVPEEARLRGRRHSRSRDAAAISHHYDVSNEFYEIVLGRAMTYSCAYFAHPGQALEAAQRDKHELVSRKLRLQPGERVLDVGCGWGSFVLHAAEHFGVRAVGVTLSDRQADLAEKRVAEAGLSDRIEIRVQDERDVDDGPYDAIASVGMFEHVGESRLAEYFRHLHELLAPGGRLLNHGIARPAEPDDGSRIRARFQRAGFVDRFVFPDGALHPVGAVVSTMQREGFEVRDLENLREHYGLTLRRWVANLEASSDRAVSLAGEGRTRVWRLYMAASARNFEEGRTEIHQVLGVKPDGGRSGLPLRRADTALA